MSRQRQGKRKENELSTSVYKYTNKKVFAVPCGFSGNHAIPSPDILIPFDGTLRGLELKTSSRDKITVRPEHIEDLAEWSINQTEVPTYAYLGVKFNHWVAWFHRLTRVGNSDVALSRAAEDCPFDAWMTDGGNLKIEKPQSGNTQWKSSAASDEEYPDAASLINTLERLTDEPSVTEVIDKMDGFNFQ